MKRFILLVISLFFAFDLYAQCSSNPTIIGNSTACVGSYTSYSTESGMTLYSWTIIGGTIMGSPNTSSILVIWNLSGSQSLQVNYTDASNCRPSVPSNKVITVNASPIPNISGNTSACQGSSGHTYTTESGQSSYHWFISSGGSIISGDGTNSIDVAWNSSGNQVLYVTYIDSNGCSTPGSPSNPNVVYKMVNVSPLVANISGNTTACLNTNYSYTTESGKSSYNWSVVGGTIISGLGTNSITVNWNTFGTQNISVAYSDPLACISTPFTNKNINVINTPIPTISGNSAPCQLSFGNIYTTEPGMSSYTWSIDFGNGASPAGMIISGQGTNSISVIWNRTGNQSLSVTYNNGVCSANSATIFNVNVNPVEYPIIAGSSSLCQSSLEIYSTQSGKSGYNWSISSGGTITAGSGTNSITVMWHTSGTNTVSVNYVDINGCTAPTLTKNVSVNARPVPTITGTDTFCDLTNATYTTESGKSAYAWSISPGGTISTGSGTNSVTVIWNTYGAKTISVNYTNPNGCNAINESTKNITIKNRPTPTLTGFSKICSPATGIIYSTETGKNGYTWAVTPDGTITSGSGTNSITVNWATNGSKTVSVNYTDVNGCNAVTSTLKTIMVNPTNLATITSSGPTTFCQGGTVTLTATAGTSYLWSGGETQRSLTVNASGNYSVIVTNSSGCATTSAPVSVVVNPLPVATITADGATTFCQGDTVTLTAPTASSYLWSNGATSQSILVSTSGNYNITTTNTYGCTATSSPVMVTVYSIPVATITASGLTTFCQGGSVKLTASTGSAYLWSTGATSQSITIGTAGSYWVTVSNGVCEKGSAPTSVVVNATPSPIINGKKILCNEAQTTLTAVPGISESVNYQWSNGSTNPAVTVGLGTYTVTVSNSANSNCSATATARVTRDNSTGSITRSGDLCLGGQVLLMAGSGSSYIWSNGQTGSAIYVSVPGTYSVDYYNTGGCYVGASFNVMPPKPNCSIARVSSDAAPNLLSNITTGYDTSVPASLSISALDSETEKSAELFLLFPNPAKQILNIRLPTETSALFTVEVFDSLGKLLHRSTLEAGETNKQINIADFTGGVYVVQLRNHNQLMKKQIIFTGN